MSVPSDGAAANGNGQLPIERVLAAIGRTTGSDPTKTKKGWQFRCPAHDDDRPSLSISETSDARVLIKCHAGCSAEDVVRAIGLTLADLFAPSTSTQSGRARTNSRIRRREASATSTGRTTVKKGFATARAAVAELERLYGPRAALWTYRDTAGKPVGIVVRWDRPDGSKDIRPVARRQECWRIEGMAKPYPLYGLPKLAAATRVYVCEGEKAADAALAIGATATTSPHGSQSARSADWSPLAGKDVVLLPDNDAAGRKYSDDVAAILAMLKPRPMVRVVELPDLPEKCDIVDWIAARGEAAPDELLASLEALVDEAATLSPPRPAAPERYQDFPVDALPEPLRSFVAAGAAAIGCDASFIALPALTVCAAAIGNSRRVLLKQGWTEPSILWAVIVGESGSQKSPAFSLVMRPLRDRQRCAMENFAAELADYQRAQLEYERDLSKWKRSKDGGDPPEAPTAPTARRCIVSDTTVEAAAPLLRDNCRGVLLARDELSGWLGSFDRYAKGGKGGGDAAHWLSMFNADSILVDRKTAAGPIFVSRAAVCVTGGIQPGVLNRSLGMEHRESGLAARLLLTWPPRRPKRWTEAEIAPEIEEEFAELLDRLFDLRPAIDDEGRPAPSLVVLSPPAKRLWIAFCNAHGVETSELSGDLAAAWSKLEGYAARLALVLHCVDVGAASEIQSHTMEFALRLIEWFKRETRRVYAMLSEDDGKRGLRRLAEWIDQKGGSVSARELQQGRRDCPTATDADAALSALVAAGYGQWQVDNHGGRAGRPVRRFVLASSPIYAIDESPDYFADSVDVDVDARTNGANPPANGSPRNTTCA